MMIVIGRVVGARRTLSAFCTLIVRTYIFVFRLNFEIVSNVLFGTKAQFYVSDFEEIRQRQKNEAEDNNSSSIP